jgi:cytochrome c oxidase subunit IV
MADTEHSNHPGVAEYVQIGIILAVLTAIEVGLFFVDAPRGLTVSALLFLTAVKFFLVVAWFMHLRFDNRLFRRLMLVGLALAGAVYSVVGALFFFGPV